MLAMRSRPSSAAKPRLTRWDVLGLVVWLAVVLLALLVSLQAQARDLGVIGPVHPITEPDMVEEIKDKIRAKQASGEWDALQAEADKRIKAHMQTPTPVEGVRTAQVARTYHFDPSVRFDEAVLDHKGRVVVPAGQLANPLAVVTMNATLLFFDGRDPKQVARVKAEVDRSAGPVKPILVAGSPAELTRLWKRPVFFDQSGHITRRLGIRSVPARVRQDGLLLLVQEFPAP